jgi:hypothetical protein
MSTVISLAISTPVNLFGPRLTIRDTTMGTLVEMEVVTKMWEESLEQVCMFVFLC